MRAMAFLALVTTIVTASVFAILQGIDGISLKAMVDAWENAPAEEKAMAVRGYAVAYTGFSQLNPLYSQTSLFVVLFLMWMLAIGIMMWRRKEAPTPT
jgi:hypothetical protein